MVTLPAYDEEVEWTPDKYLAVIVGLDDHGDMEFSDTEATEVASHHKTLGIDVSKMHPTVKKRYEEVRKTLKGSTPFPPKFFEEMRKFVEKNRGVMGKIGLKQITDSYVCGGTPDTRDDLLTKTPQECIYDGAGGGGCSSGDDSLECFKRSGKCLMQTVTGKLVTGSIDLKGGGPAMSRMPDINQIAVGDRWTSSAVTQNTGSHGARYFSQIGFCETPKADGSTKRVPWSKYYNFNNGGEFNQAMTAFSDGLDVSQAMKNTMEGTCYPVSLRTLHVSGRDATDLEIQRCCTKRYMSQTDIDKLREDMHEENHQTGLFCDEEELFTQFLPVDPDSTEDPPGIYADAREGADEEALDELDEQCYCQNVTHAYVAQGKQGMANMGSGDGPWRRSMWVCYVAALSLLLFGLFVRMYLH